MLVERYQGNFKHIPCNRWTWQTLCCYVHKGNCAECSNEIVCEKYNTKNEYGIKAVKYAMLLSYARLGKPKGEEYGSRL